LIEVHGRFANVTSIIRDYSADKFIVCPSNEINGVCCRVTLKGVRYDCD